MIDPPDKPKEQMDAALDILGFDLGDTSGRSKCAEQISFRIKIHQLHRKNELSKINREYRDGLKAVRKNILSILGNLRQQDSGFGGLFLDSPDEDIAMLEKWEKQIGAQLDINPKKSGRPSKEADRPFIAALVDIFEKANPQKRRAKANPQKRRAKANPQKRRATSTSNGPFVGFVRLVYELSTGRQRDLIAPIQEVLRLRNHRNRAGDKL